MKKILIGVGVVVVLLIIAAIAAPFFIPIETIKTQIVAQTEAATGRKLRIDGPVKLTVLPVLAVEASQVGFANAPGAATKDMLTLSKLLVSLKLFPLLSGEVAVDQFVLIDPVINLEVDRNGRPNWQFGPPAAGAPSATPAPAPSSSSSGGMGLAQIRLGDVRLENGKLTYRDVKANTVQTVENINVKLKLPSLSEPFDVDGSVMWNAKTVRLTANVKNPQALLVDNKASDVVLNVTSEPVNLSFTGSAKIAAPLTVGGAVDLNVPSVRGLATWTGNPIQFPGDNLGPLAIKGKVGVNGAKYAFTDAIVNIDAIRSKGSVEFDGSNAKPYIKGALDVEMLDLNPYLPPEKAAGAKPAAGAPAPAGGTSAAKADDWSDDPIDFSGLRAADADLALAVGGIKVRKIEVGKSALKIALKNGRLGADLTELNLYEGKGTGQVVVDAASGNTAAITSSFKLAGLQIAPLLTAAADMKMLTGKGGFDIDLSTRGGTERQFVSALNGKGGVKLNDGTIKGIDVLRVLCNPVQAVQALGGKLDPNASTAFSELGLTHTITNGVLKNQDLALLAPVFRAEGSGSVDLPKRTVDYRAVPKLVASCTGQGGDVGKVGLGLPIKITGPWSNVSVLPDFNPLEILKGANPVDAIKGLIPGASGGTTSSGTTGGTSGGVGGALKGLFGR